MAMITYISGTSPRIDVTPVPAPMPSRVMVPRNPLALPNCCAGTTSGTTPAYAAPAALKKNWTIA